MENDKRSTGESGVIKGLPQVDDIENTTIQAKEKQNIYDRLRQAGWKFDLLDDTRTTWIPDDRQVI